MQKPSLWVNNNRCFVDMSSLKKSPERATMNLKN
nr:MAG TPA: hypothetical protein [Inoviridae sp.]